MIDEYAINITFSPKYKMSEYSIALFTYIVHELNRLKIDKNFDLKYGCNIDLPFIKMNVYQCDIDDDDIDIEDIPNFEAFDVKIYWYKYINRRMTANVNFNDDEWAEWGKKVLFSLPRN